MNSSDALKLAKRAAALLKSKQIANIPLSAMKEAIAVGLGHESWLSMTKPERALPRVTALDLRPRPSLEPLHYLGVAQGSAWGTAITSPHAFGKVFVVVADKEKDAQAAAEVSQTILGLKGRRTVNVDFNRSRKPAARAEVWSTLSRLSGDTAFLSGFRADDKDAYKCLTALLDANWQVVVRLGSASELHDFFEQSGLHAEHRLVKQMLGLKRDEKGALTAYFR